MCPPDSKIKYPVFYVYFMFMYYYPVCYFTCIFYAVERQISMLFIDNKRFSIPYSVFRILYSVFSLFCLSVSLLLVVVVV